MTDRLSSRMEIVRTQVFKRCYVEPDVKTVHTVLSEIHTVICDFLNIIRSYKKYQGGTRMKTKKWLRILALALSLLMVISMAGCGSAQSNVESQSESSKQETEQSSTKSNAEIDSTPITLTWGFRDVNIKEAGILSEKSEAWKYVEEKLGTTVEIVTYDIEKYNVLAAGGDLPDIISTIGEGTPIADIVESGQLLPLNDLLDSYGQNIMRNIPYAVERVNSSFDAIYLLPTGVEGESNVPVLNSYFATLFGRYDVYKAIGSPEMDGLDDLLQVAKQMQDYERQRTGRDDIYAFSNYYGNGDAGTAIPNFHMGWNVSINGLELNLETFEMRSQYMNPDSAYWYLFEFYNKAYRMGIMDPDSLIMENSEYADKITNGSTLFSADWTYNVNADAAVPGYEEYACLAMLPGSLDFISFLYSRLSPLGYVYSSARAINVNCEYPERAMQLLDWLDSDEGSRALRSGLEGESWEYVDGVPQYTDAVYEAIDNGTIDDYWMQHRLMGYGGNGMNSGPLAIKTEDGYPSDLTRSEDYIAYSAPDVMKAYAADFGCEYPGQVYEKWIEEGKLAKDIYCDEYYVTISNYKSIFFQNEYAQMFTDVKECVAANVDKVILAESDEAFEQAKTAIIEQLKELGGDKVLEESYRQLEAMDWGEFVVKHD